MSKKCSCAFITIFSEYRLLLACRTIGGTCQHRRIDIAEPKRDMDSGLVGSLQRDSFLPMGWLLACWPKGMVQWTPVRELSWQRQSIKAGFGDNYMGQSYSCCSVGHVTAWLGHKSGPEDAAKPGVGCCSHMGFIYCWNWEQGKP